MKAYIFISILVFTGILLVGLVKKVQAKTEHQPYDLIYKDGNFEIRYYPVAVMASVEMGGSYDQERNSGFRTLANYIFGGNQESMQIPMTAPVRVGNKEGQRTMSFVMPSEMSLGDLPKPMNDKVLLHHSKSGYTGVIRYGGYTNEKEIQRKERELVEKLTTLQLEHEGQFEYAGYNPPYQMVNRRNEVLVELKDFDPTSLGQETTKVQAE